MNDTSPGQLAKGSLVMARVDGQTWSHENVGIVLDVRTSGRGIEYATIIFEGGTLASVPVEHALTLFSLLDGKDDSSFILNYALLSNWQVEEDFHDGRFNSGFARARVLCAVNKAKVTSSAVTQFAKRARSS